MLQPRVLDLNGLVRDLDTMLRRLIGEDIQLTTALHADPLRVKADPGQLEQVLTNLVVNARDAMPHGRPAHPFDGGGTRVDRLHAARQRRPASPC